MKKTELYELRNRVNEEIKRRELVNMLLENEYVQEIMRIENISLSKYNYDVRAILDLMIDGLKIDDTNGIYVCTDAFYNEVNKCFGGNKFYTVTVDIDSKLAEVKIYKDIESGRKVSALSEENRIYKNFLISDFEKNNIVLNPYNTTEDSNGYYDVRLDFFENAVLYGQERSKKILLNSYNRL